MDASGNGIRNPLSIGQRRIAGDLYFVSVSDEKLNVESGRRCVGIRSTGVVLSRRNSGFLFGYSRGKAASFPSVIFDDEDIFSCRLLLQRLSPVTALVERLLPSSSYVVNISLSLSSLIHPLTLPATPMSLTLFMVGVHR